MSATTGSSQSVIKAPTFFVAFSGWLSWIISAGTQLLVIRLLVTTLGVERYAAFAVLFALNGWFLLSDLGLGVSLQNTISKRLARAKSYQGIIRKGIESAAILLLLEVFGLISIHKWLGNLLLRRFDFLTGAEKATVFLLACTMLLLSGLGQVAYKVWFGEHKGYLSNFLPALSLLAGLLSVRVSLFYTSTLQSVIVAYLLPPALVSIGSLLKLWINSSPTPSHFDQEPIIRNAANFGGFTLVASLVTQIDVLIVAQFLEPGQIASYAVISKVFATLFLFYGAVLQALWPVCSTHLALHDWAPVKRYVSYALVGGLLFIIFCTALIAWKIEMIYSILASGAMLVTPTIVIVLFGTYYLVRVWTDTIAMVLQSQTELRALWISTPIQALLAVVLQIYFVRRLGMEGAVLGVLCSFLLTAGWILPSFLWRSMRNDEKRLEKV